jgi:hypothetical protein
MDKYDTLMDSLKNNEPFALGRFNDGEMLGIRNAGQVVARGDQLVSVELQDKLKQAILHRQHRYWVGLPCSTCFPSHFNLAKSLVHPQYPHQTHAVVFTNRNWKKFVGEFPKHINDRNVYWVGGDDQDVTKLPFKVTEQYKVPKRDAWSLYEDTLPLVDNFAQDSLVLVTCGPMARVLVKEWYEKRPDLTIIDIGSTFDPFTRNVWHNCHKGWGETGFNLTAKCEECN